MVQIIFIRMKFSFHIFALARIVFWKFVTEFQKNEETEITNKDIDNDEDITIIAPTRANENGEDMDVSSAGDENDKKRKSMIMSPLNSLSQEQLSKKTNNGASSQIS